MMSDVYNGFYLKWSKQLPKPDDDRGWGLMQKELSDILERYSEFTYHGENDYMWNPAAEIGMTLMRILDDRARGLAG